MKKGKTITNKITGEKITWVETSADTNGKYILFEFDVAPKGYVPVRHIHPSQMSILKYYQALFDLN